MGQRAEAGGTAPQQATAPSAEMGQVICLYNAPPAAGHPPFVDAGIAGLKNQICVNRKPQKRLIEPVDHSAVGDNCNRGILAVFLQEL